MVGAKTKTMEKDKVMAMMSCKVDNDLNFLQEVKNDMNSGTTDYMKEAVTDFDKDTNLSCWGYWHDHYYPKVIHESYPVYIQERSLDKGKKAFEIIKILKDKKLVQLRTVGNFIDLMDELIKIL